MQLAERRYHPAAPFPCRVCYSPVSLDPHRIRFLDGYWVMQCPHCSGSFPVRAADVPAVTPTP